MAVQVETALALEVVKKCQNYLSLCSKEEKNAFQVWGDMFGTTGLGEQLMTELTFLGELTL